MTYPQYSTPAAPKRRPWLLIVGSALLLISLLLCAVGGISAFGSMTDVAGQTPQSGPQTINVEQGETRAVWTETAGTTCTVTGPAGPLSDTSTGDGTISVNGSSFERVMSFEAEQGGDHVVSCTAPVVVAGDLSVGGMVMAAIGSGLCCLSVVLVAVGLVLWLRRRKG